MSNIANLGLDLGLNTGPIRRIAVTLTTNDSGSSNTISLSDAAAIANWRVLWNTYNFASDTSVKAVPTPLLYAAGFSDGKPSYWEVEDYRRKMRNAPSDFEATLPDCAPYIIKNMDDWESQILSAWLYTEDNYVLGILNGSNLDPLPMQPNSYSAPYYNPAGYDTGSDNKIGFRLSSGVDRNSIVAVKITDGSVTTAADFFSLRNVTGTITSPAVTGCVVSTALDDVNPAAPGTTIRMLGAAYTAFTFTDNDGVSGDVTLDSSASLTEVSGVYTIDEATLLTAGHAYTLKVAVSGYDVTCGTVTVPS